YTFKNLRTLMVLPHIPIIDPIRTIAKDSCHKNGFNGNNCTNGNDVCPIKVLYKYEYPTVKTVTGIIDPSTPNKKPSMKNGHLINAFVAPTSFIIPISSLLAIIVNLIVFEIKNMAVYTKAVISTSPIVR